jgi:hypothetical protein
VSQNDPPRRQLSPSGKDAWSMLVKARMKVLEEISQDHHILFPSSIVSSDICICGEGFVRSQCRDRHAQGTWTDWREDASPTNASAVTEGLGLTPNPLLADNTDFDWQEWDAAVGISIGLMP